MAGDWMKFEKATLDKPEVHCIAAELKIDPDMVIGKLLRVWSWFDENTQNGNAPSVTLSLLDRIAFAQGFAQSMSNVGWLVIHTPIGVTLPNFSRHNGETAKKRALGKNRIEKYRGKVTQPVTQPVTQNTLPEKRREESKPPISPKAEVTPKAKTSSIRFAHFWELWPGSARKVAKAKCEEHWLKRGLDSIADQIIAHVTAMKGSKQWLDGFDPAPLTYLHQRRWEDGMPPAAVRDDNPLRGCV